VSAPKSPEQAAILHLLDRIEALEAALRFVGKRLDRVEADLKAIRRA
jgi:hypothetical protein